MGAKYLLPCSCGQSTPVELAQAGETIACACGLKSTAPTMRGLKQLPVIAEARPARKSWGVAQGVALLGGLVTVGGLAVLGWMYVTEPRLDLTSISKELDQMSLLQTWRAWEMFGRGLPGRYPDDFSDQTRAILRGAALREHANYAGLTATAIGLAVLGLGGILQLTSTSRRKP